MAEAPGVWPGTMAREFLHGSELKREVSFTYYACNLFVIGCIMSRDHVFAEQDYLWVRLGEACVGWMLVSSAMCSIKLHVHGHVPRDRAQIRSDCMNE